MDGFKKRLRESIQFKLSFWLAVAIFTVAVIASVIAFLAAYEETQEFHDQKVPRFASTLHPETLGSLRTPLKMR